MKPNINAWPGLCLIIILTVALGGILKSCYHDAESLPPGDYVRLHKTNLPVIFDRVTYYYGPITGLVFQCSTGTNVTLVWTPKN